MNNVLIYFCANVQILIRPGTIVFTKSDLTPGEKHRISPRFDLAPGVNPAFLRDSTAHPAQGQIFLQDSTPPDVSPAFLTDSTAHPMQGQIFSKYSIHTYPVAPRSQSVHSLPILQPHGRDTLLPFLHMNGLNRPGGQI